MKETVEILTVICPPIGLSQVGTLNPGIADMYWYVTFLGMERSIKTAAAALTIGLHVRQCPGHLFQMTRASKNCVTCKSDGPINTYVAKSPYFTKLNYISARGMVVPVVMFWHVLKRIWLCTLSLLGKNALRILNYWHKSGETSEDLFLSDK